MKDHWALSLAILKIRSCFNLLLYLALSDYKYRLAILQTLKSAIKRIWSFSQAVTTIYPEVYPLVNNFGQYCNASGKNFPRASAAYRNAPVNIWRSPPAARNTMITN
jgi:hypothetical protein